MCSIVVFVVRCVAVVVCCCFSLFYPLFVACSSLVMLVVRGSLFVVRCAMSLLFLGLWVFVCSIAAGRLVLIVYCCLLLHMCYSLQWFGVAVLCVLFAVGV